MSLTALPLEMPNQISIKRTHLNSHRAGKFLFCAGLALAASSTSHAALIAHWDLDSADESLSATAGTLSGDAAVGASAIAPSGNGALTTTTGTFDSNMVADDITGFGGSGSFTILSWFQTSSATDQTIFNYSPSEGSSGGADLRFFVNSAGDFRVEMSSGAGFDLGLGSVNLNDGATHMVGVIFDSSTGDSFHDLDLYVDGTLYNVTGGTDHTVNLSGSVESGTTEGTIIFGMNQPNNSNVEKQFIGTIDDIAIYDQALDATALASIAANGVVIPEPSAFALLLASGVGTLVCLRRRKA
ncbi:PEP-CTERM sorting domain-containing protein [Coraliomargarita sp. SDUM461003]|uniref:PEP-CTERM sorting domain-containing protein n=1 Tax=Thalassobacterium maritimum TaxID=3041265 RepID=A0ABU1AZ08_9BACT|nr:LamG-like jellyroll fold domain-containing protein [Coraliomargarita sp. SDUM461003]MDQ8209393.1 PEP-CTERM sorting domain-containing protein [Coraliomargarita sp. SDUM461003]